MTVTEAYIDELLTNRRSVYRELHEQIRENRALRYGEHHIPIPIAYASSTAIVRSSIVADILFRVVATLTTDDPVVRVPPIGPTEKAKRQSNRIEGWSQSAYTEMQRAAQRAVFRMGIDAASSDGLGVFKCTDRRDVWRGFPRRQRGDDGEYSEEPGDYLARTDKFTRSQPFPFHWTDLDPLTFFPLPGTYGGLSEVLEVTKRSAVPAMRAFNVKRNATGTFGKRRPGEVLTEDSDYAGETWELAEYWTDKTVSYKLDQEIVDERTHNYGRVPYFPLGGHMTSSRDPHRMYQSVIQPFAHLIPTLDSVLTMTSNWVYLSAYPFLELIDPTGQMTMGQDNPLSITGIKPGDVLRNVRFLQAPNIAQGVSDLINLLNIMIDRSGLAAVMYGQGASSSSGYMVSQLMTAAQLVYAPIIENARMALEQMFPFMWQLIERVFRRSVPVLGPGTSRQAGEWQTLGPEDTDGYRACQVSMKPRLPMDEIAQRDSAGRMVGQRLWSRRRAMEHIGVEQPEDEQDEIYGDEAREDPEIKAKLVHDAAVREGIIKEPPALPQLPPGPPGGGPVDQFGQPMGGPPMTAGFPEMGPVMPQIPGVNLPLVPPPPAGAGMPTTPSIVQRQPGGPRLGPESGPI